MRAYKRTTLWFMLKPQSIIENIFKLVLIKLTLIMKTGGRDLNGFYLEKLYDETLIKLNIYLILKREL